MKRKRKTKRRGRPRQVHAKRRTTTRAGRRTGTDPVDLGTDELRTKRRRTTGFETLSHEEPLAWLFGHGHLTVAQYNAGRDIAELLATVARERLGSTWQRILSGPGGILDFDLSPAAERAHRTLARLAVVIGRPAGLVFAVCGGRWHTWAPEVIARSLERVSCRWSLPAAEYSLGHTEMNFTAHSENQYSTR